MSHTIANAGLLISLIDDRRKVQPSTQLAGSPQIVTLISIDLTRSRDVCPTDDGIAEEDLVARLPFEEVLLSVTSGPVACLNYSQTSGRGAAPMRSDGGCQWVVQRLLVDSNRLHAFINEPFLRLLVESLGE